VTVRYAATGGSATGGGADYTLAAGTLSFSPGARTANIALAITNDSNVEADETIEITLSSPTHAALGSRVKHTYTIEDNDVPDVKVGFDSSQSSGSESEKNVKIRIVLSKSSKETVTVRFAVTGGTARGGGVDYTLDPGTVIFRPGDESETITMTVIDDKIDESDETVVIQLFSPTNATLDRVATHTYTIRDDDGTSKGKSPAVPSGDPDTTSAPGQAPPASVPIRSSSGRPVQ
jgi:hypothetical protein